MFITLGLVNLMAKCFVWGVQGRGVLEGHLDKETTGGWPRDNYLYLDLNKDEVQRQMRMRRGDRVEADVFNRAPHCTLLDHIMRLCPYMLVPLAFAFDIKGLSGDKSYWTRAEENRTSQPQ